MPINNFLKKLLFLVIISFPLKTFSQVSPGNFAAGLNPLSVAEPFSNIGLNLQYRFSARAGIWTEASWIYGQAWKMIDWQHIRGFRFILQPRYYVGAEKKNFISLEFRLKNLNYNSSGTFLNVSSNDTMQDISYKGKQWLIGGALVFGKQVALSGNGKFFAEITFGIGAKHRFISRNSSLTGYHFLEQKNAFSLAPHYEYDNDGTPYFPCTFRICKVL